jgi:putative transferase (TIGR04331 family)
MDAIVAKPYGLNKLQKNNNFSKVILLEKKLFPKFCELLNNYHNVKYSKKFWQILIGIWFRRTLALLLNRINSLDECLKLYKISCSTFFKNNSYSLASLDETSFYQNCNDDRWNNLLYSRIINFLETDIHKEFIEYEHKSNNFSNFKIKSLNKDILLKREFLKKCLFIYNKISNKFLKKDDAVIMNSYLPLGVEIKLELALKQIPQLWFYQERNLKLPIPLHDYNKFLRKKLKNKFIHNSECNIENIVSLLIFELLPLCYLEGFKYLQKIASEQPWPDSPKFIFTSNNYTEDEVFKFWTASKVDKGFKYYVGQHGNGYGFPRNLSPQIEEITSDKFITWGFQGELPQHIPAFVLKTAGEKNENYSPKGGLLLIEFLLPARYETWDTDYEFIEYFNDQKKFVLNLDKNPKNKLTIRLHAGCHLFKWCEYERWFDFDPSLKLDNGAINIKKLISKNRLIVHSYNSTGLLETLSQNIPTLAFWQKGLDIIENKDIQSFQALVDVGIIHLSAKSAANKVNDIWNDVESWWNQSCIQKERKKFCELYAKTSSNPVGELKKILLS